MAAQIGDRQPFDIGRVIGGTFRAIGSQAVPFLILGVVLLGVPGFLTQYLVVKDFQSDPTRMLELVTSSAYWLTVAGYMVAGILLHTVVSRGTINHLLNREVEMGDLLLQAFKLILPMIALAIIVIVMCAIGLMLLVVPGIILFILFSVSVPVIVEEGKGIFASMGRSRQLTKGSRWWIFLLLLVFFIAYGVVANAITLTAASLLVTQPAVYAFLIAIMSVIVGIFWATMFASLYVELCTIQEGHAGEELAGVFA